MSSISENDTGSNSGSISGNSAGNNNGNNNGGTTISSTGSNNQKLSPYISPEQKQANDIAVIQEHNSQVLKNNGSEQTLHDDMVIAREKELEEYEKNTELMRERQLCENEMQEYLVRGAILRCTCGTHCRRLNLYESHNYYMNGRPLMNEKDSMPGNISTCESDSNYLVNIPYFGVCKKGKSPGESILLKRDKQRDPYGNIIEEQEKEKDFMGKAADFWCKDQDDNVRGHVCEPKILSNWLCSDESCMVDGYPGLKGDSFLICQYGGIIEVLQSGQSLEDNIDELDDK